MSETVFAADPARLLIIKFKIHPVLSLLISALVIGLGAGLSAPIFVNTVEKGA